MTRVGIVYSTKRRKATVQVVEWLKAAFESNGLEVEVGKPEEIDTLNCDLFVLGTSVYAGQVQESILEFISQNQDLLREKPVATFVVCKGRNSRVSHELSYRETAEGTDDMDQFRGLLDAEGQF